MKKSCLVILACFLFNQLSSQNIDNLLQKAFQSIDSSDHYFKLAKKAIKNPRDEAEYLFCKNARHTDFGNQDSAIYYGNLAANKFVKLKDHTKQMYVYNNLGKTYINQGSYEKAVTEFFKGLKIAEARSEHMWIVEYYRSIANAYHDFEDFEKGILYAKKSYKAYLNWPGVGKLEGLGSLSAIAINFDDWNKPDSALYYHYKVYNKVKGSKDTLMIGGTYNNIGNTLLKQKKFGDAKKWIEGAIRIIEATKGDLDLMRYHYERATNYTNLATIAYNQNKFDEAERLFKISYDAASKSQNVEKLRDYFYQQYLFNKKRGDIEKAFYFQDEYVKIRDSVFNGERAKTFASLEAKYQNEKKEKDLLKSKAQVAESTMQIRRKNTQFTILALISIALLAITYLVYRQQKLKHRQIVQEHELKTAIAQIETQNTLQEQRLSISRDLHDNIGSQLTFIISSVDNIKYAYDVKETKLENKLSSISNFAKDTIVELRDTIWAMNSTEITFEDLQTRILNFIEKAREAQQQTSLTFNLDDEVQDFKLTSIEGMNIYRTIQEAVNNALKYANSTAIEIAITNGLNGVRILIDDNGSGFDTETAARGNGIANMKKRVGEINGKFQLVSGNDGTKITIVLPKLT